MDPIYRPTWQKPVGLLAHSWIPAGEGEGCWVASHVRWDPGATTQLLDTDLCFSWSLLPSWSHLWCLSTLSNGSLPGSASHLYPDLREAHLVPGDSAFLPVEVPRGYGFSATSPRALSLMFTKGKGCMCQKQQYKYGARTPPESL